MDTYIIHTTWIGHEMRLLSADKISQYHTGYNNRPSNAISFMSVIPSTSDRLHGEFVLLLFLQTHRETDRFFATSGVQDVISS